MPGHRCRCQRARTHVVSHTTTTPVHSRLRE
jgi:hypothetical protein